MIWGCIAADLVGFFANSINGTQEIKVYRDSFRHFLIYTTPGSLIFLEPLNLFLYIWRFLNQLEREETHKLLKVSYRWFEVITIVLMPLCFYGNVLAFIIESAKYYAQSDHDKASHKTRDIAVGLLKSVNALGFISNLISCAILVLVMRLLHIKTNSV